MAKKGSITVFLALILSLMVSLICASIESVRMAAARTQILNGMDIGLYSLFGQYDRTLLEKFDLFAIDGTTGQGEMNMAGVYDNMKSYMEPILEQNSQRLSIEQGGFTGYRLLTDENGGVFYHNVIRYMEETVGSQGVQFLLDRLKEETEETENAEREGERGENENTMESYDSAMTEAVNKKAEEEAGRNASENFGDGTDTITTPESVEQTQEVQSVENPIPIIRRIKKMGILSLVVPASKGVSDKEISGETLVSARELQQGMAMSEELVTDDTYYYKVLFQKYLMDKLGNYMRPASGGLSYQIEYILGGKGSDTENLKFVANRLLLIREGINLTCLYADSQKMAEVEALALLIGLGCQPAAKVIGPILMLCWSFAESILDVRELFSGGRVPLVKQSYQWQISLQNLPHLLERLDSDRKTANTGVDYEEYLHMLLLITSKEKKIMRGMDMIELTMRTSGEREGFRLDACIVAVEISMDVKANRRKTFTITRQYCYD